MISYELAFRLKKAGFPQKIKLPPGETQVPEKLCYIPTLEELIEACNYNLAEFKDNIFADLSQMSDLTWEATVWGNDITGKGSTPSEAVAMLYLKLHDKN